VLVRNLLPSSGRCLQSHCLATGLHATVFLFLSRLLHVLKWGLLFDEMNASDYYWPLPLYWGKGNWAWEFSMTTAWKQHFTLSWKGRPSFFCSVESGTLTDWMTAKLLLPLASSVILGSESLRAHDHILLSDGFGSFQATISGTVFVCLVKCCWASPAQWFLVPSPKGHMTTFYSATNLEVV
jgi:hypothetical protein